MVKLIIRHVLINPKIPPEISSNKPIKVKSIKYFRVFVILFIRKADRKKVNIIEENPIIRLFVSGKKDKNNDAGKEEKFKAIKMLIKKERKEIKLTKNPFLYPL